MKGTVERAELAGDPGLIRGEDGKLYRFQQPNVRSGATLRAGMGVDFIGLGEVARDIHALAPPAPPPQILRPLPVDTGTGANQAYAQTGAYRVTPPALPAKNLWTYFIEGLTANYVKFTGRARRSEYWGYTLFWWIGTVLLLVIDSVILGITGATLTDGQVVWFFYLSILWQLGTVLPNIAIVVRRLHDIDVSGWVWLVKLIDFALPIGTLIIFVMSLIDSKPEPNTHGVSPKYSVAEDTAAAFS